MNPEVVRLAPALEKARIEETWAGLRPDSPDHLPIIGPTDVEDDSYHLQVCSDSPF